MKNDPERPGKKITDYWESAKSQVGWISILSSRCGEDRIFEKNGGFFSLE